MLSPSQLLARDNRLTASRVPCLMTGDEEKILNLWREMVGDPAFVAEDLSDVWPVQLGSCTEPLNLDWYQRKTGNHLSRRGEVVIHPYCDWAACTLDAWDDTLRCPVEAKHVGGFEKLPAIVERYTAQAHWQMHVTQSHQCILSIIEGAREPVRETIEWELEYGAELIHRAEIFMECVRNLTPPVAFAAVEAPVKAEKLYDYSSNNAWVNEAVAWMTTRKARRDNETAEKELKKLVPDDAARVVGGGVECRRDRAGRLSIREHV